MAAAKPKNKTDANFFIHARDITRGQLPWESLNNYTFIYVDAAAYISHKFKKFAFNRTQWTPMEVDAYCEPVYDASDRLLDEWNF